MNDHWEALTPEQHDEAAAYFRGLFLEETVDPLDDNGTGKAQMRLAKWEATALDHEAAAARKRKARAA